VREDLNKVRAKSADTASSRWRRLFPKEDANKVEAKCAIAAASMVISLIPLMVEAGNNPLLVGIIWVVWGVRVGWLLFMNAVAEKFPAYVEEPTQQELHRDMIGFGVTFILVMASLAFGEHASDMAKESAGTFYNTLQIGAAFDRADFERQIEAKGGRVSTFANAEEAEAATGATKALWDRRTLYSVEAAVFAAGSAEQYRLWFRAPTDTWRTAWGWGVGFVPFDYAFEVENGKIAGKSAMRHGDWLMENGRWVNRGANAQNPIVRGAAIQETLDPAEIALRRRQSEEDARQRAEAFYATLPIGAPFGPKDFKRRIQAMNGQIEHFADFQETVKLYADRRSDAYWQGAPRFDVAVVAQGGGTMYYTAFFTPYRLPLELLEQNPGEWQSKVGAVLFYAFYVKDGVITQKSYLQEGAWVNFR
jgi:hypothetical protein